MEQKNRLTTYSSIATQLALLSDHCLLELLEKAEFIGSVIGGSRASLEVDGTRIFVKKVRLTDIEKQSRNKMSTANLFELPLYYQYGIGSAGFGVWRELACHIMSTNWVITGECSHFPLMYHWRILPESVSILPPTLKELDELDRTVEYWGGSAAIRTRLEENQNASENIVFFMESFPGNLYEWLECEIAEGDKATQSAINMIEGDLKEIILFMKLKGLVHFDAHFKNILTDGHQLYLTDFGLATGSFFELSKKELDFVRNHENYDQCYMMAHLVNSIISGMFGSENRDVILKQCVAGIELREMEPSVSSAIKRYAPVAVVMNEFFYKLRMETKETPYPINELKRACVEIK